MLRDKNYIQKTRELISSERTRIIAALQMLDTVKVYEAIGNFILVQILDKKLTSADVFEHCIRKGLMIRDCSSFEALDGEYVRFCILSPENNTRLLNALKEIL